MKMSRREFIVFENMNSGGTFPAGDAGGYYDGSQERSDLS